MLVFLCVYVCAMIVYMMMDMIAIVCVHSGKKTSPIINSFSIQQARWRQIVKNQIK